MSIDDCCAGKNKSSVSGHHLDVSTSEEISIKTDKVLIGDIPFFSREYFETRYNLTMASIEDNHPTIARVLRRVGFKEAYDSHY